MGAHVRSTIFLVPFLMSCAGSSPPSEHVKVSSEEVTLVENDFEIYLTKVTSETWTGEVRIFCPRYDAGSSDDAYRCLARQAREVADILDPPTKREGNNEQ